MDYTDTIQDGNKNNNHNEKGLRNSNGMTESEPDLASAEEGILASLGRGFRSFRTSAKQQHKRSYSQEANLIIEDTGTDSEYVTSSSNASSTSKIVEHELSVPAGLKKKMAIEIAGSGTNSTDLTSNYTCSTSSLYSQFNASSSSTMLDQVQNSTLAASPDHLSSFVNASFTTKDENSTKGNEKLREYPAIPPRTLNPAYHLPHNSIALHRRERTNTESTNNSGSNDSNIQFNNSQNNSNTTSPGTHYSGYQLNYSESNHIPPQLSQVPSPLKVQTVHTNNSSQPTVLQLHPCTDSASSSTTTPRNHVISMSDHDDSSHHPDDSCSSIPSSTLHARKKPSPASPSCLSCCLPSLSPLQSSRLVRCLFMLLYCLAGTMTCTMVLQVAHERMNKNARENPLRDIAFDLNPTRMGWAFRITEISVLCIGIQFGVLLFFHAHRLIIMRRFFFVIGTLYFYRSILMLATSLPIPGTHLHCAPKAHDLGTMLGRAGLLFLGGGLSISGNHQFCGDYMYSGHTCVLMTFYLFITNYTPQRSRAWRCYHFVLLVVTYVSLIGILLGHDHYTIDVLCAYYVTTRLIWTYHTSANVGLISTGTSGQNTIIILPYDAKRLAKKSNIKHNNHKQTLNMFSQVWWWSLFIWLENDSAGMQNVGNLPPSGPVDWQFQPAVNPGNFFRMVYIKAKKGEPGFATLEKKSKKDTIKEV